MRNVIPHIFLSFTAFLLFACSAQPAPQAAETSELGTLELAIELDRKPLQQASQRIPLPDFAKSEKIDNPPSMILLDDGRISQLEPAAASAYVAAGYQLEPVQTLTAFGEGQGHLDLLQANRLWSQVRGEGVTVAVIDSGADTKHEALRGALVAGYDFMTNSEQMTDTSGHGTAIAALIAGRGGADGIEGVAPAVRVQPLRVLDDHDRGSSYDTIRAILFAADLLPEMPNPHKADVINLSLGGYSYSAALHSAVKQARAAGVILVAASGNAGTEGVAYPAAFPEVIAVGAAYLVKGEWQLANYSSYGAGLELLAPTGGISTTHWGEYGESGLLSALAGSVRGEKRFHGTSVAAAEVTGLVALLLSSGLKPAEVRPLLAQSSSDLNTLGWDATTGLGVINPVASLRLASEAGLTTTNTKANTVQLLDAGSHQELDVYEVGMQGALDLPAAAYRLVVQHTSGAHSVTTEPFDIVAGKSLQLTVAVTVTGP